MKHDTSEPKGRITVLLGDRERRELLARAAERAQAEGRPISMSEIARDVVRAGLEARSRGPQAA